MSLALRVPVRRKVSVAPIRKAAQIVATPSMAKEQAGKFAGYKIKEGGKVRWRFNGYDNYSTDRDAILAKIKAVFEKSSWTVPQFALYSGVSDKTVYKVLSGKSTYPRLDTIWRIARALEMNGLAVFH